MYVKKKTRKVETPGHIDHFLCVCVLFRFLVTPNDNRELCYAARGCREEKAAQVESRKQKQQEKEEKKVKLAAEKEAKRLEIEKKRLKRKELKEKKRLKRGGL